jgi:hypothetical protein
MMATDGSRSAGALCRAHRAQRRKLMQRPRQSPRSISYATRKTTMTARTVRAVAIGILVTVAVTTLVDIACPTGHRCLPAAAAASGTAS